MERHEAKESAARRRDKRRRESVSDPSSSEVEDAQPPSQLMRELLQLWSFGETSAVQVQVLAAAAAADGAHHPDVLSLARIAAEGSGSHHHRDLMAFVQRRFSFDFSMEPWSADVPFKTVKGADTQYSMVQQPFVLPHELFATLFDNFQDEFCVRLAGASNLAGAEARVHCVLGWLPSG